MVLFEVPWRNIVYEYGKHSVLSKYIKYISVIFTNTIVLPYDTLIGPQKDILTNVDWYYVLYTDMLKFSNYLKFTLMLFSSYIVMIFYDVASRDS